MRESWSVHLLHGRGASVVAQGGALGGAADRCAARSSQLAARSELLRRAARGWWPRVAREGWVTPRRWNAFDAFPSKAWPRDAAVDTHK